MAVALPPSGETGEDRYAPLAEINVTPMVDVMLVLFVIFMVTAPLLTVGVPLDLPKSLRSGLAAGGRWIRTFGSPTDPLPFSRQPVPSPPRFDGLATRNRKF
jgi:biopolymer transport protein TolR